MHMEVRARFSRFVWRGLHRWRHNPHPSRGSIPHWKCANTTGSHTLHLPAEAGCESRLWIVPLLVFIA